MGFLHSYHYLQLKAGLVDLGDIERKYPCHLLASPLRPRLRAPWRDDRRGPGSRPAAGGRLPSAGLRRRHRVPTWIWSASGELPATGAGRAGGICPHPGPTAPAAASPRGPARRPPPPGYSGAAAARPTRLGRGCDRRCLWAERARPAAEGRGRAPEPSEKARRSASGAVRRGGGSGAGPRDQAGGAAGRADPEVARLCVRRWRKQ